MFLLFPARVWDGTGRDTVPFVNSVLIAVNVIAFFLCGPDCLSLAVGHGTGFWTIITHAFAHYGMVHLAGNMWLLWLIGNPVNRRLGNGYYLLVYLGTALTLGLLGRLFCADKLLGASGAIYAVVMTFVMLMPAAVIQIVYGALFPLTLLIGWFARPAHWVYWFIRWDTFQVRAWVALVFVVALQFLALLLLGRNWTNGGHVLGLLCGLVAVLLLPTRITMGRQAATSSAY